MPDPFEEFGGSEVSTKEPENDPFSEFGGSTLKKKELTGKSQNQSQSKDDSGDDSATPLQPLKQNGGNDFLSADQEVSKIKHKQESDLQNSKFKADPLGIITAIPTPVEPIEKPISSDFGTKLVESNKRRVELGKQMVSAGELTEEQKTKKAADKEAKSIKEKEFEDATKNMSIADKAKSIAASFGQGAAGGIKSAINTANTLTTAAKEHITREKDFAGRAENLEDRYNLDYYTNEIFPEHKDYKTGTASQVSKALGQGASMLTVGALGGGAPVVTQGFIETFDSEYKQAKDSGADEDTALKVGAINGLAGAGLEALPIVNMLGRANKATGGGLFKAMKATVSSGFKGGAEEYVTESIQQVLSNKTAQETYDETRKILDGVAESGEIGGATGFILGAVTKALGGRLSKAQTKEDREIILKTISEVESADNQVKEISTSPQEDTTNQSQNGSVPIPEQTEQQATINPGEEQSIQTPEQQIPATERVDPETNQGINEQTKEIPAGVLNESNPENSTVAPGIEQIENTEKPPVNVLDNRNIQGILDVSNTDQLVEQRLNPHPEDALNQTVNINSSLAGSETQLPGTKESSGEFENDLVQETNGSDDIADEESVRAGKKSVLNRAFEGQTDTQIKQAIERHGLTYKVESHIEATAIADEIINDVGIDKALDSVNKYQIHGAPAAVILGRGIEDLQDKILSEKNPDKLSVLIDQQSEFIKILDDRARFGGQFNSVLQSIYNNSDFNYDSERQINQYREVNNGVIPVEVEEKMKSLDLQLKETIQKLTQAEERARIAEEQNIVDSIKNDIKTKPSRIKKGKALVAEGIDDIAEALGITLMATGDKKASVVNGLVKIGRGMIEQGIATIENVTDKLRALVNEKFGGKLDYNEYHDDVFNSLSEEQSESSGKIRIKQSLIRSLVESGNDNIDDLVIAIKKEIKNEYPDATDREIRDAITKYGKTVTLNQDELEIKIRKLKRIGRLISAIEDVRYGKRASKSGLQRDKIDAEERALAKELREAMKELPIDQETQDKQLRTALDTAKQRLRNQIEDLNTEIQNKEQVPRSARTIAADEELENLRKERDVLKKEHENIFKDDVFKEKKRLEISKRNAGKKIIEYERRIKDADFAKRPKNLIKADKELNDLRVKKLEIKDTFDKLQYENELKNRTKTQKVIDGLWEIWGLTRALRATGEMSFILLQGGIQTLSRPQNAAKAFSNAMSHFGSEKRSEDWLRELRTKDYYQRMKDSKLALSEPDYKLSVKEEQFLSGWVNHIWDVAGLPLKVVGQKPFEVWKKANPIKAVERAGVGYMNTLRAERYLQGEQMLQAKGKTIEKDREDYKNMADAINTLTGRASLGRLEGISKPLSTIFFSPRNWASTIKTVTPYAFWHFGKMTTKNDKGKTTVSVAQKIAMADFMKFVGVTGSIVMTAVAFLNNDDDEETGVEFDPTSSDFMKIKLGNTRVDPWGGKIQHIVLMSRLMMDSLKKGDGKSYQLGKGSTSTKFQLMLQMATNKLAPSTSLLYNYANSKIIKKDGDYVRTIGFDKKEYDAGSEIMNNLYPIYAETIKETYADQPETVASFLTFLAFMGVGVSTYESKNKTKNTSAK